MSSVEVSRILNCSTHYAVLKLGESSHVPSFTDAQEVRRRYKELAVRVHPDKNRATELKTPIRTHPVSNSFSVLLFWATSSGKRLVSTRRSS
ncbi:hypothetical protein PPTG_24682 [Phytophthora nicotianae INRA-310]|uniref:J domain-containing protein n=1 Tax=Phytophthora nicotianae (strain INRA-310) TaxID=761204 RepID=W2PC62_PHYN3|nr:hypothetical protein PPTG_24682 [Phytophthora nicotianae INRA-310]ETM98240.1 hypothetical protein PPTG_24682 [Phytophthora nicotianae INRA-310]